MEGEGSAPNLVQICSSPTHPPDCDRDEQLRYVHHRLNGSLLAAATEPGHPLHKAAVAGVKLDVRGHAVVRDSESEFDGRPVRLISLDAGHDLWEVEILAVRGRNSAVSGSYSLLFFIVCPEPSCLTPDPSQMFNRITL